MRADTTQAESRDLAAIWDAMHARIAALLDDLTDGDSARVVPTVRGATVGDLLRHMISTCAKAVDNPDTLRAGPITLPTSGDSQSPITDLTSQWRAAAESVRDQLASCAELASFLITDTVMCEHDLRAALDTPGARDDIAIKVALDELSGRFSDRVDAAGLPPLRVTVEQWGTIAGTGRACTCVVADRFEFVRAMSGRRAAPEIHRWNWGEDPDIYIPVMTEGDVPTDEVHERDPRIPEHMRDREFVL